MAHTPARLAGHGVLVVPRRGYRLERVDGMPESSLRVTYGAASAVLDVLAADADASPHAVVAPGPPSLAWRILTDTCGCAWPRGFVLADDPDGLSAFLLAGARDALMWVSGPMPRERALPIENLADVDQRVRAIADEGENVRIDLDYVHEGEPWWQRRYVLRWGADDVLVLTAQAMALDEDDVRAAIDELAQTIAPALPN